MDDLRRFVNETLCLHNQLEVGAFHMSERLLMKRDQPCGVYFCLHGPRAVKISAIWDMFKNIVLFYSATGERFLTTKLIQSPPLAIA